MSAFRHPAQAYGYGPLSPAHGAFAQPGYGYALEQATKLREAEQKQYEEYVAAEKKAYEDAEAKHKAIVEAEQKQYEEYVAAQKKAYEDACAKEKEYYEKERALAEKLGAYHAAPPYGYGHAHGYGYPAAD